MTMDRVGLIVGVICGVIVIRLWRRGRHTK